MIGKVISGGQTGVDRAALDVAIEYGIPHGGFCPRGRRAEDGVIPDRYNLIELVTADYPTRTRKNVMEADGTLIILDCPPPMATGGTAYTISLACASGKPWRPVVITLGNSAVRFTLDWLLKTEGKDIRTLNIVGPRESKHPGIYAAAVEFLRQVLPDMRANNPTTPNDV